MSGLCFKTSISPSCRRGGWRPMHYETLYAELAHVVQRYWFTYRLPALARSAGSSFVDDFSGSIAPSQERAGGFPCWKFSHVAIFVNRLVLPERNEATAR